VESMADPHAVITAEQGAELQRLHAEYIVATNRAAEALRANDGRRFLEEEAKTGNVVRRIREILGTTGQPWNA
jgi:hypothetical protein